MKPLLKIASLRNMTSNPYSNAGSMQNPGGPILNKVKSGLLDKVKKPKTPDIKQPKKPEPNKQPKKNNGITGAVGSMLPGKNIGGAIGSLLGKGKK